MPATFLPAAPISEPRLTAALERLDGLVDWERRARGGGRMRVDVEPARDLLDRLGSPHRGFRVVHVAGTKGKGSVSALIAAGLRSAGVREGVYSSPHVERVQERIRIGGESIADDAMASALERALAAHDEARSAGTAGKEATWFDVLTAAALSAFEAAGIEHAVLECGLGGRLDSTNVVDAELSVLTNVYLEHVEILGDTRERIAVEKAGIIAPGSVVVSAVGPPGDPAADVVGRVAAERGARLIPVEIDPAETIDGRNLRLARSVLDALDVGERSGPGGADLLSPQTVAGARLPGRGERRAVDGVPVLLDGAHVPASLDLLLEGLERGTAPPGRPVVVLGLGRDKDAEGLLKLLVGRVDRVLCTSTGSGPAALPSDLALAGRRLGLEAEAVPAPRTALAMAVESRRNEGWVLVTGSLHLIGELRSATVSPASTPTC